LIDRFFPQRPNDEVCSIFDSLRIYGIDFLGIRADVVNLYDRLIGLVTAVVVGGQEAIAQRCCSAGIRPTMR